MDADGWEYAMNWPQVRAPSPPSTRSDPFQIVWTRACPVRAWRLRGLYAKLRGTCHDESGRVDGGPNLRTHPDVPISLTDSHMLV